MVSPAHCCTGDQDKKVNHTMGSAVDERFYGTLQYHHREAWLSEAFSGHH